MSFHLLQPIVYEPLLSSVGTGAQLFYVSSIDAIFVGASLLVDSGSLQEVVTATSVGYYGSPPAPGFSANCTMGHAAGALIQGATFPLQAATDPLFTTTEILSYLARAQNEFLAAVPVYFLFSQQTVSAAQRLQTSPVNTIQMGRVAAVNSPVKVVSLNRAANVVTGVAATAHGLTTGGKFSILQATDPSFIGAFTVASIIDLYTWTYLQTGADASIAGLPADPVALMGSWTRLYEVSQQELSNQNPGWQSQTITALRSWYEDRVGLYGWGVNGIPAQDFPVELLSAVRDTDALALSDGFLVPDLMVHIIRYKALEYCFSKDGEMKNAKLAAYCGTRFQRGVIAAQRFLTGIGIIPPLEGKGGR